MLSRIANNLYWAGRYLERIDNVARFVPVTYFTGLDGPVEITKQNTLEAINEMAGNIEVSDNLNEREVLYNIAFDKSNVSSLGNNVTLVRENCRGARDIISTELWQSINTLYHTCINYDVEEYLTIHLQDYMLKIQNNVALCKARIDGTLIQNQVWSIINLGILLERGIQIIRIIEIKLEGINDLNQPDNHALNTYEIANLLKCLESYDMYRKHYLKPVSQKNALEFLLLTPNFPRSLRYCIDKICNHLLVLGIDKKGKNKSVKLIAENLKNEVEFTDINEAESNLKDTLNDFREHLYFINNVLINNYFD